MVVEGGGGGKRGGRGLGRSTGGVRLRARICRRDSLGNTRFRFSAVTRAVRTRIAPVEDMCAPGRAQPGRPGGRGARPWQSEARSSDAVNRLRESSTRAPAFYQHRLSRDATPAVAGPTVDGVNRLYESSESSTRAPSFLFYFYQHLLLSTPAVAGRSWTGFLAPGRARCPASGAVRAANPRACGHCHSLPG